MTAIFIFRKQFFFKCTYYFLGIGNFFVACRLQLFEALNTHRVCGIQFKKTLAFTPGFVDYLALHRNFTSDSTFSVKRFIDFIVLIEESFNICARVPENIEQNRFYLVLINRKGRARCFTVIDFSGANPSGVDISVL